MYFLSSSVLFALVAEFALAAPAPAPTPAPITGAILENRGTTCVFSGSAGASSASKSKKSCATIVLTNVAVPSGTTLDLTDLTTGTSVIFEGTTTFGYKEWEGPLISVSGTDITVTGTVDLLSDEVVLDIDVLRSCVELEVASQLQGTVVVDVQRDYADLVYNSTGASSSVLDGGGAQYWDGQGSNGGKTKPKFFYAHSLTNSVIQNVKIINSPVQVYSVDGASGLLMNNLVIDDSAGDAGSLGHNTDGFDVGDSSGVYISNANVKNQDDCLAINSGTNITFTGGTCSGGHGLSIGSVGGRTDNIVQAVMITNSSITNSQNGVRIKTVYGATGSVSGVTYSGISMSDVTNYGIVIEQDYENGSPTGTPTNGVGITDLTISSVTGSVASSATDVYILCGKGSCSDWTWWGVSITGGKKCSKCENVPSGASC